MNENRLEIKEKAPKEILLATHNEAKLKTLRGILGEQYKIVGLKDIGIESQAEEDGIDPKENALKKARYCFEQTGKDSFSIDYGFFIEGLPQNEQPGPSVRRVIPVSKEREPTDEEVIEYYQKIISRLGGKANAYWLRAMAYVSKDGEYVNEARLPKILTDVPSNTRVKGFPMTSMQIDPRLNKYESEMTEEEKRESHRISDNSIRDFVKRF